LILMEITLIVTFDFNNGKHVTCFFGKHSAIEFQC